MCLWYLYIITAVYSILFPQSSTFVTAASTLGRWGFLVSTRCCLILRVQALKNDLFRLWALFSTCLSEVSFASQDFWHLWTCCEFYGSRKIKEKCVLLNERLLADRLVNCWNQSVWPVERTVRLIFQTFWLRAKDEWFLLSLTNTCCHVSHLGSRFHFQFFTPGNQNSSHISLSIFKALSNLPYYSWNQLLGHCKATISASFFYLGMIPCAASLLQIWVISNSLWGV